MIQRIKNNAFARNSLILFAGTMLGNVLNYAFHLIIGRLVSVEIYGEMQSLTSLINIVSVPAMTITMIATKYAASFKPKDNRAGCRIIWKYLRRKIAQYIIPIFVVIVLATPAISKFLNISSNFPLILIWTLMFISFFASVNMGILSGWQRFKDASLIGVLGAGIKLVLGIVLVKLSFGLNGIIGSFMLAGLASYIASVIALKFIIKEKVTIKKEDEIIEKSINFNEMRRYLMPVFIGNLAINILSNVDMVLAKHNLVAVEAGQYGALTIVSKIIFFATGIIATVLFAMSAEDSHNKNHSWNIFKNASYLMAILSGCAIFAYFVAPKLILSILFGSKYAEVSSYLGWFAIMVVLFSFVNLIFQYLMSVKKTKIAYWLLAIASIAGLNVLFFGKSFYVIVMIMSLAQIIAIIIGIYFLFQKTSEQPSSITGVQHL